MNSWEELRRLVRDNPEASDEVLADKLLAATRKNDLHPLIVRAAEWCRRATDTHLKERAAFEGLFRNGNGTPYRVTDDAEEEVMGAFRALFDQKFSLGNGIEVTWRTATSEQHRQRLMFLEMQMDGLLKTRAMHVEAIRRIEETGVTSLGEIQ
jgi:hypothetical protein